MSDKIYTIRELDHHIMRAVVAAHPRFVIARELWPRMAHPVTKQAIAASLRRLWVAGRVIRVGIETRPQVDRCTVWSYSANYGALDTECTRSEVMSNELDDMGGGL